MQNLRLSGGTSLASAILGSLSAITGKTGDDRRGRRAARPRLLGLGDHRAASPTAATPQRWRGGDRPRPTAATTVAQNAGVHIETVGVGTAPGANVEVDGYQLHTALDADTLTALAQATGGAYHPASDAAQLNGVASTIDLRLTVAKQDVPLAGGVAALALALLVAGAVLTGSTDGAGSLMTFTWPWALLSLLVVPLVLGLVWLLRRRRRRAAVAVTSIALVRAALPRRTRWVRLLPSLLLLLGFALLGVGAARPQATRAGGVGLDDDHARDGRLRARCARPTSTRTGSRSPSRRRSSSSRPRAATRIGLVAFAGVAGLQVPPTTDTDALITAINSLSTARGTAIGSAILTSIDGIAAVDPTVAPSGVDAETAQRPGYAPDVIVVLTDGANTQGPKPADGRRDGRRARRPGVHDRLRHHDPDPDGLHRPAGRRLGGRRWRRVRRRLRRRFGGGAGEPAGHRRGRAEAGRRRPPAASTTAPRTPTS